MNIKKMLRNQVLRLRRIRFRKKAKMAKDNKNVTILSNCCLGGLMYHDAEKEFISPTINLYFEHHGFIDFVNNLEKYCGGGSTLTDTGERELPDGKGPIGVLKADGCPDLRIHFLHYSSFEEAKEKWFARIPRMDYSRIFLVIEAANDHEHQVLDEYVALPYPKIIYTDLETDEEKSMLQASCYRKKKGITDFEGVFGRRAYDCYDFFEGIFAK